MNNSPEITAGKKLKITRLRLLLTRKDVSFCTGLPTTTIERMENGDFPYPADKFQQLVAFYDYSMEEIYSNKEVPDWIELRRRFLSKHRNNNDITAKLDEDPDPKEVILYRVLASNILDDFKSARDLAKIIKSKYNWTFLDGSIINALNSIEKEGLIVKSNDTPNRYKRKSNILPEEIDGFYQITRALEKITYKNPDNLVNPAFRRMAIVIKKLIEGENSRKYLMDIAGLGNESNNINRTIRVLEDFSFIEKTEKAARSSNQKYRLTEKGRNFLSELGIE